MIHYRETYATIHLDYLMNNIDILYQKTQKPMMAIIKANAYGHGYQEIANTLKDNKKIAMFGVATLKEAIDLRKMGISKDILVLGAIPLDDVALAIDYDISLTLFSKEYLQEIMAVYNYTRPLKVHIKIDTGMNRIGIKSKAELKSILSSQQNQIQIEGVFTHFATADDPAQTDAYDRQMKNFKELIQEHTFKYIHCQNSAAMIYHPENFSNLSRVGIAMYGVDPALCKVHDLKQVMSLYTKVIMIKKITKGESIGYGLTYTALEDEYIATLPIGYADGLLRANQGRDVYIHGRKYPIVGRICMDQTMVRVDENVSVHDRVEIFGEHISLIDMAKELDTIPYEIMCLVSERVEREYIKTEA